MPSTAAAEAAYLPPNWPWPELPRCVWAADSSVTVAHNDRQFFFGSAQLHGQDLTSREAES